MIITISLTSLAVIFLIISSIIEVFAIRNLYLIINEYDEILSLLIQQHPDLID